MGKSLLPNAKGVQIMSWWYSGVVSLCKFPYLTFVTKFEPLCGLKKIVFKYCVCVRSFEHFCGRKNMILIISSRIVFSLVKQKVSGGQEQEQVFVAMEFTVQVSTFY